MNMIADFEIQIFQRMHDGKLQGRVVLDLQQ
jgi:hypothetical protein